jgi:hypothetical protein
MGLTGLALVAQLAVARPAPAAQADAMAFIRVVADVRFDFGGVRPPVDSKDVELATGSGFVVAPSGLVLTSLHVVAPDEARSRLREGEAAVSIANRRIEVAIGTGGGQGVFEAYVIASDAESDLAALQVTAADLPHLPFGDSDAVEAGRPVVVLGFPFGGQVEVGRPADAGVVPEVTVTAGSLSAARVDPEGDTRYLQTDATVSPGNSGGPMLDEDGYVVGLVRMKLARDAGSRGAGFSVPVNVVKDFLEANSLLEQLPVARLRPGVRHTLEWKRIALELPDGYSDSSAGRELADAGEVGEIGFRAYRLATGWPVAGLEEALLGGREVPGFVPAPATAGRRQRFGRRRGVTPEGEGPPSVIGSGAGADQAGRPFRVEYAVVDRGDEKVVARYLGPPDAVAFNLGLIRRSLRSLEAGPMLVERPRSPLGAGPTAFESVSLPEGEGRVLAPAGWWQEPAPPSVCDGLPLPDNALASSHPLDYTLVLRALRWTAGPPALAEAVEACGAAGGGRARGSTTGAPRYARRFARLGVPIEARGVLVSRPGESFLLELEAPVAKLPLVEGLYERWVAEVASGR